LIPEASQLDVVDKALQNIDADHSTVIIDENKPTVHSPRFIVSELADVEKVADLFLVNSMFARYSIPENQQQIAEITASLLSGKAVGTSKARTLYAGLKENLSDAEW